MKVKELSIFWVVVYIKVVYMEKVSIRWYEVENAVSEAPRNDCKRAISNLHLANGT